MAVLAQLGGVFQTGITFGQNLNYFFGACWLIKFIAEDITKDVTRFNTAAAEPCDGNREALTKRFCDLVKIYSYAKQYK